MLLNLSSPFQVHHLVERLTDGWKPLIPGTGLPIIKRISWRDPGWEDNLNTMGQGTHKRLIRRS